MKSCTVQINCQNSDLEKTFERIDRFYSPTYEKFFEKTFIKTFNIVGLPVLVILFGLFIWMRRHSRKKQIQMIFQQ